MNNSTKPGMPTRFTHNGELTPKKLNVPPMPRANPKRVATGKLRDQLRDRQLDVVGNAMLNMMDDENPDKTFRNRRGDVTGPYGKGI